MGGTAFGFSCFLVDKMLVGIRKFMIIHGDKDGDIMSSPASKLFSSPDGMDRGNLQGNNVCGIVEALVERKVRDRWTVDSGVG